MQESKHYKRGTHGVGRVGEKMNLEVYSTLFCFSSAVQLKIMQNIEMTEKAHKTLLINIASQNIHYILTSTQAGF